MSKGWARVRWDQCDNNFYLSQWSIQSSDTNSFPGISMIPFIPVISINMVILTYYYS